MTAPAKIIARSHGEAALFSAGMTLDRRNFKRLRRGAARTAAVLALTLTVAACGGRSADPVARVSPLDLLLGCGNFEAERRANFDRIEDLKGERQDNRLRGAGRVVSGVFGNPLTALALIDLSTAIYQEIGALEARNERLVELEAEQGCGQAPAPLTPPGTPQQAFASASPGSGVAAAPAAVPAPQRVDTLAAYGELATVYDLPVAGAPSGVAPTVPVLGLGAVTAAAVPAEAPVVATGGVSDANGAIDDLGAPLSAN